MSIQSQANGSDVTSLELMIADSVTAMLAYWDKDLICRYANAAYFEWFGKTREEMVGKMTIMELLGPIYELNRPYIIGALEGKRQSFERAIPLPNGEGVRYSLINFFPDIEDGFVKGFIAHTSDITSVKLLEQQVEHSNETIRSQNKSLLNFANIVSHNLRAYANNLKTLLTMYEASGDDTGRAEIFELLKEISVGFQSSVEHLTEVVKEQNLSKVPLQRVNLHNYVTKATDILRSEILATNATVYNYINPARYIEANAAYVESIMLNLVGNAIKYRHPSRNPFVEVSTLVVGDETVLSIKDNGIGIDLDRHRQNLFGMYQTFHDNDDATGIGLFIIKYQVDSMGGYIGVESEVGKGTEFRIYFKTKAYRG